MSEVLRRHVRDFGFTHAEIASRAARLNPATAYRVVEGETANPSLRSITGIVEATALTDADAGVLYRRLVSHAAQPPRVSLPGVETHAQAARYTKDALDSGRIRDAARGVMVMSALAGNDPEMADAYEQAGIIYMGLGRWEEAQANLEAADRLIPGDIHDPALSAGVLGRKLSLMTNIGSLMAKRGNPTWALMFGQGVAEHPRAGLNDRGWGFLVMGEAHLAQGQLPAARRQLARAIACFTERQAAAQALTDAAERGRALNQAAGNLRWATVHHLFARLQCGESACAERLADHEADWATLDPEAAAMAGLFYARSLSSPTRRALRLRDILARARRRGLGEVAARARLLLAVLMLVLAASFWLPHQAQPAASAEASALARGNTGGGKRAPEPPRGHG